MKTLITELYEKARVYYPPIPDVSGEFWIFDYDKFGASVLKEAMVALEKDGYNGYKIQQIFNEHFKFDSNNKF